MFHDDDFDETRDRSNPPALPPRPDSSLNFQNWNILWDTDLTNLEPTIGIAFPATSLLDSTFDPTIESLVNTVSTDADFSLAERHIPQNAVPLLPLEEALFRNGQNEESVPLFNSEGFGIIDLKGKSFVKTLEEPNHVPTEIPLPVVHNNFSSIEKGTELPDYSPLAFDDPMLDIIFTGTGAPRIDIQENKMTPADSTVPSNREQRIHTDNIERGLETITPNITFPTDLIIQSHNPFLESDSGQQPITWPFYSPTASNAPRTVIANGMHLANPSNLQLYIGDLSFPGPSAEPGLSVFNDISPIESGLHSESFGLPIHARQGAWGVRINNVEVTESKIPLQLKQIRPKFSISQLARSRQSATDTVKKRYPVMKDSLICKNSKRSRSETWQSK